MRCSVTLLAASQLPVYFCILLSSHVLVLCLHAGRASVSRLDIQKLLQNSGETSWRAIPQHFWKSGLPGLKSRLEGDT